MRRRRDTEFLAEANQCAGQIFDLERLTGSTIHCHGRHHARRIAVDALHNSREVIGLEGDAGPCPTPFARIEFGEPDGKASSQLEAFHAACKAAGIDAVLTGDIRYNVWMKFAQLAPGSGLMALTGATAGPIRETAGTRALLEDAVREVIAVLCSIKPGRAIMASSRSLRR